MLTLSDAQILVDAAEAGGLTLMVSQNYRFFPAVWAVREPVAGGALGEVGSVYADFRVDMAARLPAGSPYFELPDPLLLDMTIHHFDLMRFTLGEAAAVSCTTWNPPGSPFADAPVANATLELASGAVVAYRGSWLGGTADAVVGLVARGGLERRPHLDGAQRPRPRRRAGDAERAGRAPSRPPPDGLGAAQLGAG